MGPMAADPIKLLRRLAQLKQQRSTIEYIWRECYRYSYPVRGSLLETAADGGASSGASNVASATEAKNNLLDTTATDGCRILASALMSGLTPANSLWFGLEVDGQDDGGKRWLEQAAKTIWTNIHASNYDADGYEALLDLVVAGMCALFVDEAEEGGYQFEQWPLASMWATSSTRGGRLDTFFSTVSLSAEQAMHTYGENMVSAQVRALCEKDPDSPVEIVRAIHPRRDAHGVLAKHLPIASCHIEAASKQVLRESGYHEMPLVMPRWLVVPNSAYALGPMYEALPDAKTLNEVVKLVLANADLAIAGMWIAENDGVLNPKTVRVGPRKVIVANSVDSMKPLASGAKFDIAVLEIERLQGAIRKVLMADQLTPQDGPAMTATEVHVRVELIRQLLGPVYGRLQSEFLQPLVERCFGLAYRAGVLGQAPQSLAGRAFSVKYISPISRAQKAVDVAAMDRYESTLAQEAAATGREELLDNYDWDAAARKRAELLGVPLDLLPDPEDIEAIRAERERAQQLASVAQAAGAMAGAGGEDMMGAMAGMMGAAQ